MDTTKEKKKKNTEDKGMPNKEKELPKEIYGYIRVSTIQQNDDRQRIAMAEQGVPAKNIFRINNPERILTARDTKPL